MKKAAIVIILLSLMGYLIYLGARNDKQSPKKEKPVVVERIRAENSVVKEVEKKPAVVMLWEPSDGRLQTAAEERSRFLITRVKVYLTVDSTYGKRYHRAVCPHSHHSLRPVEYVWLEEALNRKYPPCRGCKPATE